LPNDHKRLERSLLHQGIDPSRLSFHREQQ